MCTNGDAHADVTAGPEGVCGVCSYRKYRCMTQIINDSASVVYVKSLALTYRRCVVSSKSTGFTMYPV
jgi:hypothetical protein